MTSRIAAGAALAGLLAWTAAGGKTGPDSSDVAGQRVIASVNGEPVTLAEMMTRLGSMHQGIEEARSAPARPDPMAVLQRIIDARLVVQEARRIGLDEQPEATEQLRLIRLGLLKNGLVRRQIRNITTADPADVERVYRDSVREMSLALVLFKSEDAAKTFVDGVQACADFDGLAAKALGSGEALRSQPPEFVKVAELRPDVAAVAATLKEGGVSSPIHLPNGFAVVKLYGVRYPEDAAARHRAEEQSLQARQETRIAQYNDELRKRYAVIRKNVLATLDYEAEKPGLDALRKDRRVVADIKGGKPVTVAELTRKVEEKFYHGIEDAIQRKRVNAEVPLVLDRLLVERAVEIEAVRLGIPNTEFFKAGLREQSDNVLFDVFIGKVVNPEVKMVEDDLRAYYDRHKAEFSSPGMIRLESLAFLTEADARSAVERLRKGADLKWMRANASGQAASEGYPDMVDLKGDLLTIDSLPAGMRDALAGAGADDVRYYAAPSGPYYALLVRQSVPPAPEAYDAVRDQVATKVFEIKRKAIMDDWLAKLRTAAEITVNVKEADLRKALGLGQTATR